MRALTALAALLLVLTTVGAVPTAHAHDTTGTASVSGQVTAPAGHGVEGFKVLAFIKRPSEQIGHYWVHVDTVLTDAAGRWHHDGLAAGTYLFELKRDHGTELVNRFHGGQATPWTSQGVDVAEGAAVTGIRTPLAVGGTVSGTVRDQSGEPLETIRVLAYEAVDVWGLGDLSWQLAQVAHTDEDGRYEIDRLWEAPHRIHFLDPLDRGYERTYHPGVDALEDATTHQVRAGRSTTGVDVRMTDGSEPEVQMLKAPTVRGKVRVGQVLRVTKGRWEPGSVTVKHRWFVKRGSKVVRVAKARGAMPRLKLRKAHRGARVRVRLVARAPGHGRYVFTSGWTRRVRG